MKLFSFLFLITFLSLPAFSQNESAPEVLANQFSDDLINGNYAEAYARFSSSLGDKISSDQLSAIWPQIQGQVGDFVSKQGVTKTVEQEITVTYQPLQFKNTLLDLKLAFDEKQEIIGMSFVPHKVFELDLVSNAQFTEEEITVKSQKDLPLRGILSLPKREEKVPAVILVHGSGPHDMDETLGPNKLFRDLAHGLAAKGIAVIRYDKRTKTYAGTSKLDINTLTLYEETIEDAVSAVNLARKDKRIDAKKIIVLGHSLGGMSAPRIGTLSKHTKGIIILAGNARPLETLVLEQYEYLANQDNTVSEEEQAAIDNYKRQLQALAQLKENGTASGTLPLGLPANYWKYLLAYHQTESAAALNKPILVLHGKRDYQVTMRDFEVWKKTLEQKENVTFQLYEKLNHQMREGEEPSDPGEYQIKSDLPTYLINDIAEWIFHLK